MGCDGGTIPKRHELVKGPRKVEKVDKVAELVARWFYCALSQEKLRRPIVACELGRLYNKDAIIEFLLDKSPDKTPMESASHIKSIKNVTELNLVDNPAWSGDKESIKGDKYDDLQSARFICPVVGLEMNGRHSGQEEKELCFQPTEFGDVSSVAAALKIRGFLQLPVLQELYVTKNLSV
ncbi:protein RTF2 [Willisornis vidua]|uniref:Protein RTF2 n=1 Tax=Willisornis vidua TaxID=1566151 RepID=A0ABQ9DA66_9PASS|nr:protein RTF2 [Willisornis vidua]